MPKFHRESMPPPGTGLKLRNTRLYGSHDEQIEGYAERARGCPDPERAIVRKRRRRSPVGDSPREVGMNPVSHARHVRRLHDRMIKAQAAVKAARESGDEQRRLSAAQYARECRADWLKISGEMPEGRVIDVSLGSEVNPMVAV